MTTTSDARVMLVIVEHGSRDKVSDVDKDFSFHESQVDKWIRSYGC